MKKNTFILFLLAISALSACVPPNPETSSLIEASSSEIEEPKAELIEKELVNDRYFRFTLPEFEGAFVTSNINISSRSPSLSYGDTLIAEETVTSSYIACDINGDGYRELIFLEDLHLEDDPFLLWYIRWTFVVYDVKNAKRLFTQYDMSAEKDGHYGLYDYTFEVIDDRLVFVPYVQEYVDTEYFEVDRGHLRWSEEKGCYFEWDNIYGIEGMNFKGIYTADDTPVGLSHDEIDYYPFEIDRDYFLKYKVQRKNKDRLFKGMYLKVTSDVHDSLIFKDCLIRYDYSYENAETGEYALKFRMHNEPATDKYIPEGKHTLNWYFAYQGFNINYSITPQTSN